MGSKGQRPGSFRSGDYLEAWKVDPVCDPDLRAKVWQRIEHSRAGAPLPMRPWFVVAFLSVCALAGLLTAQVRVAREQLRANDAMAERYVQIVNPLLSFNGDGLSEREAGP